MTQCFDPLLAFSPLASLAMLPGSHLAVKGLALLEVGSINSKLPRKCSVYNGAKLLSSLTLQWMGIFP
jgi:hypothetical protein